MTKIQMQRAFLILALFSICMVARPHPMNYKPKTPTPFVNPFSNLGDVISQQIRKFDIVLSKVFKTFLLADSINKEKIEDLILFATKKLDYELKSEHHIGEMLISITKSNADSVMYNTEEIDMKTIRFDRTSNRNLEQKFCPRGQLTAVNDTEYQCRNGIYRHVSPGDDCQQVNHTYHTCICPFDFRGDSCEIFSGLKCKIKIDNSLLNCNGNSKGKLGTCNSVRKNENITLKGTISCENKDMDSFYEGVKAGYFYQKRQDPNLLFNYHIKTQKLMLSEDIGLKLQVQAINWVNISSPYEKLIPFNLTADETPFSIDIQADENVINTAGSGRIFLQLNLVSEGFSIENTQSQLVYLDLLEDKQSDEPGVLKKTQKDSPLIISMGMSGVLVLALLILFLYFSKSKKPMDRATESKDLEITCDLSTRCDTNE